jgi:hypothetical protein
VASIQINKVDSADHKVALIQTCNKACKVDSVDHKVDSVDHKVDSVDHKVDSVDHKVGQETSHQQPDRKVDSVIQRLLINLAGSQMYPMKHQQMLQ